MFFFKGKLSAYRLSQHDLIERTIASLRCLRLSLLQAREHQLFEGQAITDSAQLKVLSTQVVDFWGYVNLSKLRKQGNLA
ncbi:hypothetical protein H6F86_22940 [Phormidium sp. FACHB-592]|uniref:Transposase n=1 Tax=Stenomitos frigidus AS-A4 TaxID=2933935 RepID=A0ABV0KFX3_9CYAN|nr:hypothetical protein [Phormidium sp. FACHB-592]MBD2076691.1 hypothetical protein [Phormidium sp. FACHB-592]